MKLFLVCYMEDKQCLHHEYYFRICIIIIITEMAVILRGLATSNEGDAYGL